MNVKKTAIVGMILIAALSRLIPHAPNFTAVGGMALFAGAVLAPTWLALLVPVSALLLSDFVLGLHETMIPVYGAFILNVLLGQLFLKQKSFGRIGVVTLLSSVLFFVITNLGVWQLSGLYTHDAAGLAQCFTLAIPFFDNQVMGDLLSTGALFGLGYLLEKYPLFRSTQA